jgi:acyl-CoA thioesterase-1
VAACLLCAFIITGCGRNSSGPSTEERTKIARSSTAPVPPPVPNRSGWPVIVTFGDSLTAGVAGRSYPDQLQDLLDQKGYHYRVDNQGVSGDTTTDGLARIDNVTAEKPALVLLEFGGNDGLRGVPVNETRKNLQEMISQLEAAHLQIVLLGITLPPNYGPEYVKDFTSMYPELAKQAHLRYMPFLLLNVYQHPDMMQPDGIHPNGAGNHVVAQDVFDLIKPMLVAH